MYSFFEGTTEVYFLAKYEPFHVYFICWQSAKYKSSFGTPFNPYL